MTNVVISIRSSWFLKANGFILQLPRIEMKITEKELKIKNVEILERLKNLKKNIFQIF